MSWTTLWTMGNVQNGWMDEMGNYLVIHLVATSVLRSPYVDRLPWMDG